MNLHSIVSSAIASINPFMNVSVQTSLGSTMQPDGTQAPAYAAPMSVVAQVQPITSTDLRRLEGLNLNGTQKAIYLNGSVDGVERVNLKGGDLITLPDGTVWLVSMILEAWSDTAGWTKAAMTLQNGS